MGFTLKKHAAKKPSPKGREAAASRLTNSRPENKHAFFSQYEKLSPEPVSKCLWNSGQGLKTVLRPERLEMARRPGYPLYGKKYCGDTERREVHDLDREDRSPGGCRIGALIEAGRATPFIPDVLEQAHNEGFSDCAKCLGAAGRDSRNGKETQAGLQTGILIAGEEEKIRE
jgi:hypothetical protein